MNILGIAGWSGSGKTTLLVRLIPALVGRGLRVATLKHTHHNVRLGNAETAALAEAGARQCVIASPSRFVLLGGGEGEESGLAELAAQARGIDLVLVEGFKFESHAKIEVWDPGRGKPMLAPDDPNVVAIATDAPVPDLGRPVFARDDVEAISAFILGRHLRA